MTKWYSVWCYFILFSLPMYVACVNVHVLTTEVSFDFADVATVSFQVQMLSLHDVEHFSEKISEYMAYEIEDA